MLLTALSTDGKLRHKAHGLDHGRGGTRSRSQCGPLVPLHPLKPRGWGRWRGQVDAEAAAFNIPDAIVCLGGFVASLRPQQSVLLSSCVYIDSPPSAVSLLPLPSFPLSSHGQEGSGSGRSEQRGGGCLAGVGRARAQQSFHPQAASFCFPFHFPLPQHPGGEVWSQAGEGGQGGIVEETGVPDWDLGRSPLLPFVFTTGQRGSGTRPDLTLGMGSRLPTHSLARGCVCGVCSGHIRQGAAAAFCFLGVSTGTFKAHPQTDQRAEPVCPSTRLLFLKHNHSIISHLKKLTRPVGVPISSIVS